MLCFRFFANSRFSLFRPDPTQIKVLERHKKLRFCPIKKINLINMTKFVFEFSFIFPRAKSSLILRSITRSFNGRSSARLRFIQWFLADFLSFPCGLCVFAVKQPLVLSLQDHERCNRLKAVYTSRRLRDILMYFFSFGSLIVLFRAVPHRAHKATELKPIIPRSNADITRVAG